MIFTQWIRTVFALPKLSALFIRVGRLLMSLGKDTYQLLGLTGDKSKVMESRYMIAFDLLDTTLMKPTSKHYQRLETRLAEFDAYPVHFQITVSKTGTRVARILHLDG